MHLNTRIILTIPVMGYWLATAGAFAQQNTPNTPQRNTISFAAACEKLAQQYQVNILGDVYLTGDPPVTQWQIRGLSLEQAVQKLAQTYGREVTLVGKTYIVKAKKAALRRQQDVFAQTHYGARWTTEGALSISVDSVLRIAVTAVVVPLSRFARVLTERTSWDLQIEQGLQDARIVAYWQSASLTDIIEALAVLLNAQKKVYLSRSDEQRQKEHLQAQQPDDKPTPAEEASQRLLPKLAELLTPEEREAWSQGKEVEIPLSRLPSEVFAEAYDYATKQFQRFYERAPEEIRPPADLISSYGNIFLILPRPDQNSIGVRLRDSQNQRSYVF